jgi:hypothetical protein
MTPLTLEQAWQNILILTRNGVRNADEYEGMAAALAVIRPLVFPKPVLLEDEGGVPIPTTVQE